MSTDPAAQPHRRSAAPEGRGRHWTDDNVPIGRHTLRRPAPADRPTTPPPRTQPQPSWRLSGPLLATVVLVLLVLAVWAALYIGGMESR